MAPGLRGAGLRSWAPPALLVLALHFSAGCSVRKMAAKTMVGTISGGTVVYGSDDDPELVRAALPFALKTMESLLLELPESTELLLAASSGFTQYSYAFVETEAMLLEYDDFRRAEELRERAIRLYLRACRYGLRGLEVNHYKFAERLYGDPEAAVLEVTGKKKYDVDLLFWTGASWGSAISIGLDRPDLVVDVAVVSAMMDRVAALKPDYGNGAIQEVLLTLRALPPEMGGDLAQAREHFEKAVELSGGKAASPYVTYAASISVQTQNRREFVELLEKALAIDPDEDKSVRLQTLIVQKRARYLLENVDELFYTSDTDVIQGQDEVRSTEWGEEKETE